MIVMGFSKRWLARLFAKLTPRLFAQRPSMGCYFKS